MKRDWFDIFLPIWAWGSIAWITAGFVIHPDAWRLQLFDTGWQVQQQRMFDVTAINMPVAIALAIILGPTVVSILVAIVIAVTQRARARRRAGEAYQ